MMAYAWSPSWSPYPQPDKTFNQLTGVFLRTLADVSQLGPLSFFTFFGRQKYLFQSVQDVNTFQGGRDLLLSLFLSVLAFSRHPFIVPRRSPPNRLRAVEHVGLEPNDPFHFCLPFFSGLFFSLKRGTCHVAGRISTAEWAVFHPFPALSPLFICLTALSAG